MTPADAVRLATRAFEQMPGHLFEVLNLTKPPSLETAIRTSRVINKLSSFVANLIEFNSVDVLNGLDEFRSDGGEWKRQDPGFPDTIYLSGGAEVAGFEIKAWMPLATEITFRFRDSQTHFLEGDTKVVLIAWLPEYLLYGRPKIVDVTVLTALSVAQARDNHYHNPPDYLVIEPGDTTQRTANLLQTNTAGYKCQETLPATKDEASQVVARWGAEGSTYQPTAEYQRRLYDDLLSRFQYRLDTNFAKGDRIRHDGIEAFKSRVEATVFNGLSIIQWRKLFASGSDGQIAERIGECLNIREDREIDLLR